MIRLLCRWKIYTKTGDRGTTSLYNGERRTKSDEIFNSLGHTDELNSYIGLAAQQCSKHKDVLKMLEFIQSRLLDVGSVIATPQTSASEKLAKVAFDPSHVASLESWIDHLDSQLPPLKNFILPSGGEVAARLHVARSVCRRAERSLVRQFEGGDIDEHTYKFMNRLSDFLFIAARTVAHRDNHPEVIWKKD